MCDNCPRKCNVNRKNGELGYCKMLYDMAVAKIMMHKWEEPFISGIEYGAKGTGAIFFYGCNLSCIYCQNYKISNKYKYNNMDAYNASTTKENKYNLKNKICKKIVGDALYASHTNENNYKIYSPDKLSDEMLRLQNEGAYTISLITANIYIDKVTETIKLAKEKSVTIPFVYNTSGYDSIESLKKLDGLIDIYMPDFKYIDNDIAYKYSDVKDYVEVVKNAINEMHKQVVRNALKSTQKKLLIRHLVLPGYIEDSKKILKYLYETYGDSIYISIMNQYTPTRTLPPPLDRHLAKDEYNEVVDYAIDLGITNAFTQDEGTDNESFIPEFQ